MGPPASPQSGEQDSPNCDKLQSQTSTQKKTRTVALMCVSVSSALCQPAHKSLARRDQTRREVILNTLINNFTQRCWLCSLGDTTKFDVLPIFALVILQANEVLVNIGFKVSDQFIKQNNAQRTAHLRSETWKSVPP